MNHKEGIPRCLQRNKLMTDEVSLGMTPRSCEQSEPIIQTIVSKYIKAIAAVNGGNSNTEIAGRN